MDTDHQIPDAAAATEAGLDAGGGPRGEPQTQWLWPLFIVFSDDFPDAPRRLRRRLHHISPSTSNHYHDTPSLCLVIFKPQALELKSPVREEEIKTQVSATTLTLIIAKTETMKLQDSGDLECDIAVPSSKLSGMRKSSATEKSRGCPSRRRFKRRDCEGAAVKHHFRLCLNCGRSAILGFQSGFFENLEGKGEIRRLR
ncbi:hypothetical protein C1H46_029781 [Malus baccata]|uniref:Uncharacterized protein n=1 Tax=Malus baccata TaxID=106549 RepID=A0A540LDY9_MALBA|nr:hypothetical protein C1H46_029781 [Malus baccata]